MHSVKNSVYMFQKTRNLQSKHTHVINNEFVCFNTIPACVASFMARNIWPIIFLQLIFAQNSKIVFGLT